jgi:hypothetical protein
MKRLFVTLTLALSLISMSSFAADEYQISDAAIKSFHSSFKTASEVSWTLSGSLYKANFLLNGQYVAAYYDAEGEMKAMTRNISSTQLPIALQASLKKNYDGYWITDLFEVANEDGTAYYITLENADSKITMKSTPNTEWSNYKKVRKS